MDYVELREGVCVGLEEATGPGAVQVNPSSSPRFLQASEQSLPL